MSGTFNINGKQLYVYMGEKGKQPLLFIHGAPGIGILGFEKYQAWRFNENFCIIALEQRGVWRSQSLDEDEDFNIDAIIEDYESLRKMLNIKSWIILSHCMGARIAMEYYKKYPDYISAMLFENPVLDSLTPFEEILKIQLSILKKNNEQEFINYSGRVKDIHDPKSLESFCGELEKKTGILTNNITMSKEVVTKLAAVRDDFDTGMFMNSRMTEIKMSHCDEQYKKIYSDFNGISIPLFLMKGDKDITVPERTINEIKNRAKNCEIVRLKDRKHWIHIEDEEKVFQ